MNNICLPKIKTADSAQMEMFPSITRPFFVFHPCRPGWC